LTDNYAYYVATPSCQERTWGFSQLVPADADEVQIGLSVWGGCESFSQPCTNGNESPIFDNIRLGIWETSLPALSINDVDNYCDAFPEKDALGSFPSTETALIDAANNLMWSLGHLRLGDTLVVSMEGDNPYAEFCFRIVPGPGTDLGDPWFTRHADAWAECEISELHCVRMGEAVYAADGIPGSPYQFQVKDPGRYSSTYHKDDPLWDPLMSDEEVFPDSLFTPGTKIFYFIRAAELPGPGPYAYQPCGVDENDVSTHFEVMVLPDQCKDPVACLLYVDYFNRGAQGPIENALASLGRSWDRFDLRAETSFEANSIGNRKLGAGRYRLNHSRPRLKNNGGEIGPSLDHLAQYRVMLVNSGSLGPSTVFSDGGTAIIHDPSDDIGFMDDWINEGALKGLWLNGNNIACDFANRIVGPAAPFLANELATDLVWCSYRDLVGHPLNESCRALWTKYGLVTNDYSGLDELRLTGSGCTQRYNFDVVADRDPVPGDEFVAMLYDRTDLTFPPGYYASVDHIFMAPNSPFNTVRTKLDGFSLHLLRDSPADCSNALNIAFWLQYVLGGVDNEGYFYDNSLSQHYCMPGSALVGVHGGPGNTYTNALFQNYPNPFKSPSGTTIHYTVAEISRIEVRIFDVAGRLVNVIEDQAVPGDNLVIWDGRAGDGRSVAAGVYFYEVKAGEFKAHKKMLLVR
jgi:hypothetical protein